MCDPILKGQQHELELPEASVDRMISVWLRLRPMSEPVPILSLRTGTFSCPCVSELHLVSLAGIVCISYLAARRT